MVSSSHTVSDDQAVVRKNKSSPIISEPKIISMLSSSHSTPLILVMFSFLFINQMMSYQFISNNIFSVPPTTLLFQDGYSNCPHYVFWSCLSLTSSPGPGWWPTTELSPGWYNLPGQYGQTCTRSFFRGHNQLEVGIYSMNCVILCLLN